VTHLIVNADDFGLTAAINRAVEELHAAGVVTSATLMARGAAAEAAIEIARANPSLGVGCHVVLVDGAPALSPRQLPTLINPQTARFPVTPSAFLALLFAGRIRPAEIESEAAAQIALLQNCGLRLTHIDSHKHLHLFPHVLRPLLRAARAAGIRAVRNPFEPAWSRRDTPHAPWLRRTRFSLLQRFEPAFRRIVAEEGFVTTDGSIGVLATGNLDSATLASLLGNLPAGSWELVTHPGYNDADLALAHTRLRASREIERQALLTLRQAVGLQLTSFAGLQPPSAPKQRP